MKKVFSTLRNMNEKDHVWQAIVLFLEFLSDKFSLEEETIVHEFLKKFSEKEHRYALASLLIILFVNKEKLFGRELFERFHESDHPTDDEIDQFLKMGQILDDPERTQRYAIAMTSLYKLGPHGVSASCLFAI